MTFKTLTPIVVLPLVPVVALTLALSTGAASVSAQSERNRPLHVTKECTEYSGAAGGFCTNTSSNLARIKVWLEGLLRPTGEYSGGLAGQQRRSRCREWKQGDWPLHTRSDDRSRTMHVLGRGRSVRRIQRPCPGLTAYA